MYSTVTSPCPDFHSYSPRNIVKISATPPAIFCPQWQQRSLPLIEVHLRESTLVVEVCVYLCVRECVSVRVFGCAFLCTRGSLSDGASRSVFKSVSLRRIHSWWQPCVVFGDYKPGKRKRKKWQQVSPFMDKIIQWENKKILTTPSEKYNNCFVL